MVDDAGQVAAFFAFSVDGRVGAPVGASICDAQAVVARQGFEWNARELVRGAALDVWEFDHLVPTQQPFVAFHPRGTAHRWPT